MEGDIKAPNTGFDRFVNTLLGFFLIMLGAIAIFEREFWSSKFQRNIDFGPYHIYYGIGVAIVGVAYLIATWRKRKIERKYLKFIKNLSAILMIIASLVFASPRLSSLDSLSNFIHSTFWGVVFLFGLYLLGLFKKRT